MTKPVFGRKYFLYYKDKVKVLNWQINTFETQTVNVRLKRVNSNVSIGVMAYIANRDTGSMPEVDWNSYKRNGYI